jgi:Leucine-rich repeat (LRR) protein
MAFAGQIVSQIPKIERDALIALYHSTNGDNWTNKTGWKTLPLHTDGFAMPGTEGGWYGVTVANDVVNKLYLSSNQLSGQIPSEIGNLKNLECLYLNSNQLIGFFPEILVYLTKMGTPNEFQCYGNSLELADNASQDLIDWLNAHSNQWKPLLTIEREALIALYNSVNGDDSILKNYWKTPPLHTDGFAMPGTETTWVGVGVYNGLVTRIYMSYKQLTGSIPPEIGNLKDLVLLDLSSNQLSGIIPVEIGNLTKLYQMYLNANKLTGSIPSEIGNLINLGELLLNTNQLSGSLPPEIKNLTKLSRLHLNSNQLSGSLPPEIKSLKNLTYLYLYNNKLTGAIPPEIGN